MQHRNLWNSELPGKRRKKKSYAEKGSVRAVPVVENSSGSGNRSRSKNSSGGSGRVRTETEVSVVMVVVSSFFFFGFFFFFHFSVYFVLFTICHSLSPQFSHVVRYVHGLDLSLSLRIARHAIMLIKLL